MRGGEGDCDEDEERQELEEFSLNHQRGHLTALDRSVCLGGRTDQ